MSAEKNTIDLVIPIFDEEGIVEQIHKRICAVVDGLAHQFRFIYVDDGSRDGSAERLLAIAAGDARVTLLQLSRNFGHQAALTAGMDASTGEVVVTMDGDGQHPPELIPQMEIRCGTRMTRGELKQISILLPPQEYYQVMPSLNILDL